MRPLPHAVSLATVAVLLVGAPHLASAQRAGASPAPGEAGAGAPRAPAGAGAPPVAPARDEAPADAGDLRPPVLENRVEARYPEEAKQQRLEANVGLELVIDSDGRVLEVTITSPAGHGFDEAARDAVRAF